MNGDHGHLDSQLAVSYLLSGLSAARRLRVEHHLASPCRACRERIHALSWMLDRMRLDRGQPVPARLHAAALGVFRSPPAGASSTSRGARRARLVFDSRFDSLPMVARRSLGNARWMRFALGQHTFVLECEPEPDRAMTLRGRLDFGDPDLYRVDIAAGTEGLTAWPDSTGVFALEGVPQGRLLITLTGPNGHFRLPVRTISD